MIFTAVIVFGIFSLINIPIDLYPDIEYPAITVFTSYSGANASDIETNISTPIEDALNSIDKLKEISSVSRDNISVVSLEFEYDLIKFQEYYLKKFFISPDESLIGNAFEEILSRIPEKNHEYFVYRDFQPRNILIKSGELYYIDYQSGRLGPLEYDPASFLYSSSIFISENERNELLGYYLKELSKKIDVDTETFFENFYYFALLRLLQVLGSYGYNFDRKKNSDIYAYIHNCYSLWVESS